jgi:predicted amidohydrolase
MRDDVTIGLAQWLPPPGAAEENLATALDFVERLAADGADLIALPELWPCGYEPSTLARDAAEASESLDGPRVKVLSEAAGDLAVWLAAGSVPELVDDGLYNTALLFSPRGELVTFHRKAHLYGSAEHQAFLPGDRITTCATDAFGMVGLCVCFDGDFPEVGRWMSARGARLVLAPSAYERDAETWWDRLYPATAMVNGQWWVMANQAGSNPSITLLGGSRIVSPLGDTVVEAARAAPGKTPKPSSIVAPVAFREELERADRELAVLRTGRRPELYHEEMKEGR